MESLGELSVVNILTYSLGRKCVELVAKCCLEKSKCDHGPGRAEIGHPAIYAFGTLFEYGDFGIRITFPRDLEIQKERKGAVVEEALETTKTRSEIISWILRMGKMEYRAELYHPVFRNCILLTMALMTALDIGVEAMTIGKFEKWTEILYNMKTCVNSGYELMSSCSATAKRPQSTYCNSSSSVFAGKPIYPQRKKSNGVLYLYDMFPEAGEKDRSEVRDGLKTYRGETPEKLYHAVVDVHGFFCRFPKSGIELVGSMHSLYEVKFEFKTSKSAEDVQEWLYEQRLNFNYDTFNYATNNCTNFALEFLEFLEVPEKEIPLKLEIQRAILQDPENIDKVKTLSEAFEARMRE